MATGRLKLGILLGGLGLVLAIAARRAQQARTEVLAEIDGQPITVEAVEKALGAPLAKLEEQITR